MAAAERKTTRFTAGNLMTYFISSLFVCLTILFFSPLEIVMKNTHDFRFTFGGVWGFQFLSSVLAAGLMTLVLCLFPPRWGLVFSALAAAGGVAAWIQMMVLNGSMAIKTGERAELPGVQKAFNLLIWLLVVAAFLFVFFRLRKKDNGLSHKMLRIAGGLLILMQGGAMISLAAGTNTSEGAFRYHLSSEGLFELGRGKNVVMFVLDTADREYAEEMLSRYPELNESLSGWTYYSNATSTYSRTYPSLTYLLTGEKCWYDREPADYFNEAFRNSGYLKTIREQGTDIRIYTTKPEMLGEEGMQYVSNSVYSGDEKKNLDYFQLEKNLVRISLNRSMPYLLKGLFDYNLDIINLSSFSYRPFRLELDPLIYDALRENGGISVSGSDQNTFILYHLWSAHPGAYWDSNLEKTDHLVKSDILRGSFRFLEAYIDAMKKAGVYDNTLLIVTADHGSSDGDRVRYERDRASNPLLMVKYPSSDLSRPLERNNSPAAHEDLFATVFDALSCPGGEEYGSGKALNDYHENDPRIRMHYYTAIDEKTREVALVEYEINGDANDFSNWHKTGKTWDVLYSTNSVSEHRLQQ